jgi:hypothetical protein
MQLDRAFQSQKGGNARTADHIAGSRVAAQLLKLESTRPQPSDNVSFVHAVRVSCHKDFVFMGVFRPRMPFQESQYGKSIDIEE